MCFWNKMIFLFCCTSVIFSAVWAYEEESISVNKPVMRSPKPWHFSVDYVRCFCNLPSCVTTGYMCKSRGGGCFSDLLDKSVLRPAVYRGRHGCLELLAEDQTVRCETKGGINERTTIRKKENPKSLLLCCHHDMCNHMESPQTKNLINNTLLGDVIEDTDNRDQQQQREPFLYSNSEVWFRAATIAVPICGAVILFVLIALAVKILKSEHQDSTVHKLGPAMYIHAIPQQCKSTNEKLHYNHLDKTYDNLLRKDYVPTHHHDMFFSEQNDDLEHQIKVPLLLQNELNASVAIKKNETNATLNLINCDLESGKSITLDIEKGLSQGSEINMDKNIDDSSKYLRDVDKFCGEKTFIS